MNIIKILKSLFEKKQEVVIEDIKFSQINNWIKIKEEKNESLQENIAIKIKELVSLFIIEAKKNLEELRLVNLDKYSENARTKHLVLTGLKEYISLVENLLKEFESFNSLNFLDLNKSIEISFNNFKKRSHSKYEKATYLIGKELEKLNKNIQEFLKNYSQIISKNEKLLEDPKILDEIKERLKEYKKNESEKRDIDSEIKDIKKEIKNLDEKIKKILGSIENIKNSSENIQNLKNEELKKQLDKKVSTQILNLKQSIDFKTLAKIFHQSEKHMEMIKKFRDNFNKCFREDQGNMLRKLLSEAKLNNKIIDEKIESINKNLIELDKISKIPKDQRIQDKNEKKKRLEQKIISLNDGIDKQEKRIKKIEEYQENIKDEIKKEIKRLNVNIIK